MAKILVADDNSNIQKMVGLALKDQGIEVIAVGNGEAAVRKIADLKPDLVLADVFMPVRNGYEVCKFVKDDSALSHIPVILLVGAFDPLDEQEAQRVGADGVLKKPFVPPDPLISMVKSALTRAGVILGASTSPAPPPPMPVAAKPAAPPAPKIVPPPPPAFSPGPEEEPLAPASFSTRPATLIIDKGAQPLAFGSLLDTQTPEDDTVFSVTPSAAPVPERDWGEAAAADEPEEEEDESKSTGWRVSAIEDAVDAIPAGQKDWREVAFAGIGSEKPSAAEWAPSIEKNTLSITEEEAAALARSPKVFAETPAARVPEDWKKAIGEAFPPAAPAVREVETPTVQASVAQPDAADAEPAPVFEAAPVPAAQSSEPAAAAEVAASAPALDANSWMAGAVSPWEAEIQRAAQLSSTWDSIKITPTAVVEEASATEAFLDSELMTSPNESVVEPQSPAVAEAEHTATEQVVEEAPSGFSAYSAEPLLAPATEEILQQETANVVAHELPALHESLATTPAATSEPEPVAGPNMDEIVAKVLAKMNPEALQAVTREILKPIVEAMIKDELNKK